MLTESGFCLVWFSLYNTIYNTISDLNVTTGNKLNLYGDKKQSEAQ